MDARAVGRVTAREAHARDPAGRCAAQLDRRLRLLLQRGAPDAHDRIVAARRQQLAAFGKGACAHPARMRPLCKARAGRSQTPQARHLVLAGAAEKIALDGEASKAATDALVGIVLVRANAQLREAGVGHVVRRKRPPLFAAEHGGDRLTQGARGASQRLQGVECAALQNHLEDLRRQIEQLPRRVGRLGCRHAASRVRVRRLRKLRRTAVVRPPRRSPLLLCGTGLVGEAGLPARARGGPGAEKPKRCSRRDRAGLNLMRPGSGVAALPGCICDEQHSTSEAQKPRLFGNPRRRCSC